MYQRLIEDSTEDLICNRYRTSGGLAVSIDYL
jgi:hypothetical protein